ncbi:unnamed protein product [Moneuplotes crassus]|uniref:Uncharacterized protein n=1 Tax=Euplotes crassus TaxID=5936 RepID=A0AAD1XCY7_EUPCR|nr:unnamed protein product [Moneuplotes crassus]
MIHNISQMNIWHFISTKVWKYHEDLQVLFYFKPSKDSDDRDLPVGKTTGSFKIECVTSSLSITPDLLKKDSIFCLCSFKVSCSLFSNLVIYCSFLPFCRLTSFKRLSLLSSKDLICSFRSSTSFCRTVFALLVLLCYLLFSFMKYEPLLFNLLIS